MAREFVFPLPITLRSVLITFTYIQQYYISLGIVNTYIDITYFIYIVVLLLFDCGFLSNRSTIRHKRIPASIRSAVTCWRPKWLHSRITASRPIVSTLLLLLQRRRQQHQLLWWPFDLLASLLPLRIRAALHGWNSTDQHHPIAPRSTWFHPCETGKCWRAEWLVASLPSRTRPTTKSKWRTVKTCWKNRSSSWLTLSKNPKLKRSHPFRIRFQPPKSLKNRSRSNRFKVHRVRRLQLRKPPFPLTTITQRPLFYSRAEWRPAGLSSPTARNPHPTEAPWPGSLPFGEKSLAFLSSRKRPCLFSRTESPNPLITHRIRPTTRSNMLILSNNRNQRWSNKMPNVNPDR